MRLRALAVAVACALTSCSFTSTATHWNGRLDPEGRPVLMKATTNVGINLLVFIPLLGNITLDEMVDVTTEAIARHDGTRVRVVQTGSVNYSLAYWPLTLLVTPVTTEVYIEYEPSWAELVKVVGLEKAMELRKPPETSPPTETRSGDGKP